MSLLLFLLLGRLGRCEQRKYPTFEGDYFHGQNKYRGSPDSTNFGPPGNRTNAKIVLSGD